MANATGTFAQWLTQAGIAAARLTGAQNALLQAALHFRQQLSTD